MKSKSIFSIIFVIALLTISIFAAGCADNGSTVDETPTATPTQAPTEQPTLEPTVEPTVEPTEEPTATAAEGIEVPNIARLSAYQILPAGGMEINVGETLTFRNFDTLKRTYVLISEDNLWEEDPTLIYMRTVNYTFTETGTYTFYVQPADTKKWTLTVV
jgi:plastocyanin